jgi:hypothetical protein
VRAPQRRGAFGCETLSFWAKAEQLGADFHPSTRIAELRTSGRLKRNGVPENVIGNPLETTIASYVIGSPRPSFF